MKIFSLDSPLRSFFVRVLKDNDFVTYLYNSVYRLLNKRKYYIEVEKRRTLSIFDYKNLSKEMPYYPIEPVKDSNYYGYTYWLKKYCNIGSINFSLEHGLYNDDYIICHNLMKTTKGIITFNKYRENLLKKATGKPCLSVGPYIHYAPSLLTDNELKSLKSKLGKVLLFFPSHGTNEDKHIFDVSAEIKTISSFAHQHKFDTVLVNLFYYDILHTNYAQYYENAKFKVVTAGHRYDYNFVARLKSIILLSDYVLANDFGTNLGYCVYLNKPYFIISNNLTSKRTGFFREISEYFLKYSEKLVANQYDICNKFWGFDCVKTKEQLKDLLTQ